jgi:hypothetical protein
MDRDAEKAELPQDDHGLALEPIRTAATSRGQPIRPSSSGARSLSRARSNNGYGVDEEYHHSNDGADTAAGASDEPAAKDEFEIGWDNGFDDPACPRSFPILKKWLITLIVSQCAFCV